MAQWLPGKQWESQDTGSSLTIVTSWPRDLRWSEWEAEAACRQDSFVLVIQANVTSQKTVNFFHLYSYFIYIYLIISPLILKLTFIVN